jgi:hypothetical protein
VKVALFAPWPPQRSGIAVYAYRLAKGLLEQNVELEVFTAATSPKPLEGCAIHNVTVDSGSLLAGDAFPVFQLGNDVSFHAFQPCALARLGGLVHLHDPVLHYFHMDRTLAAGVGGYWDDLEFWYGPAVANACNRLIDLGAPPWSNAAVTAIPLFEPYLQFADAVVVHSQSALHAIKQRMPTLRGYCLPQSYPMELDFAAAMGRYVGILAELAGKRSRRRIIEDALYRDAAVALADLELAGTPGEEAIAAEILGTLGPCF